ncbi:MAG: acyl-homoserine-lactone synthase [Pseudomonadota bacterium]
MIEFVTLDNANKFTGNPLVDQHKLRFKSIIQRQNWDVPNYREMEFDQYDNPAAKYLIFRDENFVARGVSRLYPTTLPYMLEEVFPHFVTYRDIPKSHNILEGSRFCIDQTLQPDIRKRIAREIVIGYLEAALYFNIEAIVGMMYPAYLRSLFISNGWDIEYLGDIKILADGNKARAALLPVSEDVLAKVRQTTGIYENIVNLGNVNVDSIAA